MDLGSWLHSLGLEQYEAVFRENAIDETVLADLTDQDLEKLGVLLGHRRRLLRAIVDLDSTAHGASAIAARPAPPAAPLVQDAAERRQVTVLFSDLVGSTALSARMDPEDLREVIAAYHNCAAEVVRRFDGSVAQYLGDGVLVYFGYPHAHEDDPERAVRAGLELIAAIGRLRTRASLQTRVGIATGMVVVGELMRSGNAQEGGIFGETPNLAARLQTIAEPNTVVVGENTGRLLGRLFELRDLGVIELRGIAKPVRAWEVLRASSVASRFEALHPSGLTALVNREEELELLLRRWSRAKTGEGQMVLLAGEAGIGKSRLTAALQERLVEGSYVRLRYFCSPQHTDSALYPIIGQMERSIGLAHDDTPRSKLDKLEALRARTSTSVEEAALLAEMLSIANDGRYPALELTAEQRRQKMLDALFVQVQVLTRSSPALMIFEDAHWSDPTSLEAFSRMMERIAALRVLVIITYRPDFAAPWIGWPHVTAVTINRLMPREVETMIDHLVGDKVLPASARHNIIQRSDAIPLFVEEMTKALLEADGDAASEKTDAANVLPTSSVPAALHASLMSRLDRLGKAKSVAQIGAALGRRFSHDLLAAVAPQPESELEAAIGRLVEAGLLFRQGAPPRATYLFKHALVQDAAYSTLLRESRRALHGRIATALQSQFSDLAEREPELLAHHSTEAGLIEKAAALWAKAGRRSLERSALPEAAEQLTRALGQIAMLPATPALRREQIQLQVALITPLMHVNGYAALETKAASDRARVLIEQAEALGEPPEDPLLLFSVLFSFWTASFVAFNGEVLRELAGQFLSLAEKRRGETVPLMIGHRIMGSMLHTGAFAEGRAHLDQAIALYDPAKHRPLADRFGQDVRVAALSYRSWALWMLGYPDAALADLTHALRDAREIGQAASLMYALVHACLTNIECGHYTAAKKEAEELVALAEEKAALFWRALGRSVQGCLSVLTGKAEDAVQIVTSSIGAMQSTGSTLWRPLHLSFLARAYAELGQFDNAWRCIDEATTRAEITKEKWHEAETYRMAGEIVLLLPQRDEAKAEAYFERALAVARSQQAKSWELRAATSMAGLWRDQGKRRQARECLASVYGWFTEGFDTLDLKQAKALLDALARV